MARPKGSKNQKTIQWNEFGESMIQNGLPRFKRIMETTDDETFLKSFLSILEFFKPKLKRIEETKSDKEVTIKIEWQKTTKEQAELVKEWERRNGHDLRSGSRSLRAMDTEEEEG